MSTTHEEITVALQEEIPADNLKDLIDASLYMPFPFQSNRHESESAAGVDAWLRTCGLTDDPAVAAMIAKTRPAELASYNSPTVDRDVLQIVANQIAYQFIFDDLAEEVGRRRPGRLLPMLSESIGILRDGQAPVTPLGVALADLHRQVQERCTPAQAARWAWNSREYVHGLLYEAVAQAHTPPVRMGLCNSIRSLTAGIEPFYPLYEAAQPCELAPEDLHHATMRRLRRLSVDAAVWIADLFSSVKEQRTGGIINLALAYQRAVRLFAAAGRHAGHPTDQQHHRRVRDALREDQAGAEPGRRRLRGRHVRLDSRVLLLVPHRAALRGRGGDVLRPLTADQSNYVT
ncbi:terpene synthase family protein [Streptomyces sp. GTA36]